MHMLKKSLYNIVLFIIFIQWRERVKREMPIFFSLVQVIFQIYCHIPALAYTVDTHKLCMRANQNCHEDVKRVNNNVEQASCPCLDANSALPPPFNLIECGISEKCIIWQFLVSLLLLMSLVLSFDIWIFFFVGSWEWRRENAALSKVVWHEYWHFIR